MKKARKKQYSSDTEVIVQNRIYPNKETYQSLSDVSDSKFYKLMNGKQVRVYAEMGKRRYFEEKLKAEGFIK